MPAFTRRAFLTRAALATCGFALGSLFSASPATAATHTIRRGDSLSKIAQTYGTNVRTLKRINNLKGDKILRGQKLKLPENLPTAAVAGKHSSGRLLVHRYTREIAATTRGLNLKPGRWKTIVVHHSAIDRGNAEVYGRYHRKRGMENGLAYHFVIGNGKDSGDGEIEMGPRWLKQLHGGHVKKHSVNETGIGICMVGNYQEHGPTRRQIEALTELLVYLRTELPRPPTKFAGHKEIDGPRHTVCPGRHFPLKEFHNKFPSA